MSKSTNKPIVIFCDFDGTITERDMIMSLMDKFAPIGWETMKDAILAQQVSVQEGVAQLFSLIPSSRQEELIEYALDFVKIRGGFGEFVKFCRDNDITLLVTSGGIDFFVLPILSSFGEIERIYCNESDFSGDTILIRWPHTCDDQCDGGCGLCKPTILRKYPAEEYTRIVIGDSITDLKAARIADLVFARSLLLQKCKEEKLPHLEFTDFYDVRKGILQLQKEEVSV